MRQFALKLLHDEVQLVSTSFVGLDMHLVVLDDLQMLFFYLQFAGLEDAVLNALDRDLELKGLNCGNVDLQGQVASLRRVNFFDVLSDVTELGLFDAALYNSRSHNT